MRYNSPAFLAWQEAEHLAVEAERKLFAKLFEGRADALPTQDEVKETRALRENASRLMKQMLDEMAEVGALLRCSTEKPSAQQTVLGFRAGHPKSDSSP